MLLFRFGISVFLICLLSHAIAQTTPAPMGLQVSSTSSTTIGLTWTAPADDGSGVLDGYNVYRCEEGTTACTPEWLAWVTSGTSYEDTGVTEEKTYRYAVAASRNSAVSNWSNQVIAKAVTPQAPSAPAGLSAQANEEKVTLRWKVPADPGSHPLTAYTVYRGDDSSCVGLTALHSHLAVINNAVEDTTVSKNSVYCYTVSASSIAGEGSQSNTVVVTVKGPDAPTGLTVSSAKAKAIRLGWAAPVDDGGGALDGYNVYRCMEGETACTPEWLAWVTSGTTYEDTGVTAGKTYRYAVGASRLNWGSSWSNQVTATAQAPVAPKAPGTPTGLRAQANEEKVVLRWKAPANRGSHRLTAYILYRSEGEGCSRFVTFRRHISLDNRSAEDITVSKGSTYCYQITASSRAGESSRSQTVQVKVVGPSAPIGLTVNSISANDIGLSWTAPADDGGGALDGYNVYRCEENEAACTPEWLDWAPGGTTYKDMGVTVDKTYRYAVGANRLGWGSKWSNQVTVTAKEPKPPGTPTGLSAQANEQKVILSWTAPADDGGGSLDGYNVYRCVEGETVCTPEWLAWVTSDTAYEDTGVTAGKTYRYAVGASRLGWGSEWSNQVTATPRVPVAPGTPTGLRAQANEEKVTLSWTAPADTGTHPLTNYTVYRGDGSSCAELIALQTNLAVDTVLAEDTTVSKGATYCYTVSANSGAGESSQSDALVVIVKGPDAPTGLTVTSSSINGVRLSWGAPSNDSGGELDGYNMYRCEDGDTVCAPEWLAWVVADTVYTDNAVKAGIIYRYAVSASRLGWNSAWSNQVATAIITDSAQLEQTMEAGLAVVGRTMAADAVDMLSGRFAASSSSSQGMQVKLADSPRPGIFSVRELLSQSAFQLALGEQDDQGSVAAWTLWGRGSMSGFDSRPTNNLSLDGEVISGYLGLDYRWNTDMLLGVAISQSMGELDYTSDASGSGELETTLRNIYPYAHWSPRPGLGLWGVLGYGFGEVSLSDNTIENLDTGLEMWLAALGGRNELTSLDQIMLAVKADVFGVWMESDQANAFDVSKELSSAGALPSAHAHSSRARVALEGRANWALSQHSQLAPRLELGARWDGGDAETGLGAELGGGLSYTDTRLGLNVQASGRYLLVHDVKAIKEWGAQLTVNVETDLGAEGLAMSLQPAWGQVDDNTALWRSDQRLRSGSLEQIASTTASAKPSWEPQRMDLELRYGIGTPRGLLTPFTEVSLAANGVSRLRMGTRLDSANGWRWDFFGEQLTGQNTDNDYRIGLTASYDLNAIRQASAFGHRSTHDWASDIMIADASEEHAQANVETAPADDETDAETDTVAASEHVIEEVKVIAIRRALKDALDIKSASEHIVETLSLDDIDALPNITIAEALIRLPGVNGTRDRGNQSQATLRGLGPRMALGTVNGREVASSEPSRNIRWEQYPAELISRVQVYKTQSADLIAGGIAGTINLETISPLEHNGPRYTLSGAGVYYDAGKDIPDYNQWGNRFSGSLVKAFADEKVGIALGFTTQKQKNGSPLYQAWGFNTGSKGQPNLPAGGGDLDGKGAKAYAPWGAQLETDKMNTDRIGLFGALQFRPNAAIDIKYDAVYAEFEFDVEQDHTWYQGLGNWDNQQTGRYSDVVIVDDLAVAATAHDFEIRHVLARYNQTNSIFTQGLNIVLSGRRLQVSADIAYSTAERDNYWHSLYLDQQDVTFRYDFRSRPSISAPAGSLAEMPARAQLIVRDSYNEGSGLEDDLWSYQLDFRMSFDKGQFSGLDFGVRYADREKEVIWEDFTMSYGGGTAQALADVFRCYRISAFAAPPLLTAPSFQVAADAFGGVDTKLSRVDRERYWKVSEDNLAGYIKANFKGVFGDARYYTANIGVRIVDVGTKSYNLFGASISNDYTEILPSAGINFFLDEENIVRMGIAKAISRPPLDELRVGKIINATSGRIEGNSGNPRLDPFTATQVDLSYEWYFAPESLAAVNLYYKWIDNYIGYITRSIEERDGRILELFAPVNGLEGDTRGVELTFQAPFTGLLPSGLKGLSAGIYTNYAFADSDIEEFHPAHNPYTIAGLAKHTATADLWFYWNKFDLRLGMKYHSDFTIGFGWDGSTLRGLDSAISIDASLAYQLNTNLSLRLQGQNLTNDTSRTTQNNDDQNLRSYSVYGRTFFLGMNWKMW